MPYDIKSIKARYELPDGTPYDNPLGDLHHRNERLTGVSDLKLYANFGIDEWRLSAGLNLPVGRIEEDPWRLADLGLKHQHVQFGTGTFDPLVRVARAIHLAEGVDLAAAAGAHVPIFVNRKGYRAPMLADFAIGPRVRISDAISISATYSVLYQGGAKWHGERDPNTGYTVQGIQLSVPIRVGGDVLIVPNVFRTFSAAARGSSDSFEMDWIVGLSVEIPLGGSD